MKSSRIGSAKRQGGSTQGGRIDSSFYSFMPKSKYIIVCQVNLSTPRAWSDRKINRSVCRILVRTIEMKRASNTRVAMEHWISQRRAPRCASRKNIG
ncbi:hypothetical protein M6B38_124465 [Iris pallida]|uniref:Uncharacterized protein n=1 Tax=Iris pallida TaxID=29817 RepID=A0AAX6H2E6_IRIPA|nr:hypothetical protein M6B38_124465 [Iris pallida]